MQEVYIRKVLVLEIAITQNKTYSGIKGDESNHF